MKFTPMPKQGIPLYRIAYTVYSETLIPVKRNLQVIIMSNYIEFNDKMVFHPGYYIKEIIDESGITRKDFAKRLDTTPKNLSLLLKGEQSISIDIATKLSRMMANSVLYWLNLQNEYDELLTSILKHVDY